LLQYGLILKLIKLNVFLINQHWVPHNDKSENSLDILWNKKPYLQNYSDPLL
jgi:hypothetical protein